MRYFLAVAEELNFRRAAERLHISQPPLSMQIKSLEAEIGVPLFDRNQRSVELTKAGEFLVPHVREAVSKFEQAVDLAKLAARGEAGRLKVGFTASVPMRQSFPSTLRTFRDRFPHVTLEISHSSTDAQIEMLRSGIIDVGFLRLPYQTKSYEDLATTNIWRDELRLYVAADSKWAASDEVVPPEKLAGEPFVAFGAHSGSFEHASFLCSRAGFLPKVTQHARDGAAVLGFVAAGVGIAILPDIYEHIGVSGIVSRSLLATETASFVALAHRSSRFTNLVEQFEKVALDERQSAGGA